ncbi:Lrp/AsnC family transcriptional regulator [Dermacoccus barathri]|nr:Lrp/AsnC family transcriptional regulator [Dermacoccus barathri]
MRLRLDPVDRHLLTLLDAEPDASFADLADDLSLSARSVARRLRRLVDGGAVQVRGRTLPGFQGRLVRMIRIEAEPEAARRLAEALAREVHTSWVRLPRNGTGLLCGAVAAPNEQGARSGVEQIVAASMRSPGVRDVQTIELLRVWGSRPASDRPSRALDDVDRALLRSLAADGRMSNGALAERVGIDASTVSRRRRRLLDEGVLYLEADIHPEALTGSGDVMLWITVTPGHIADVSEALRAACRAVRRGHERAHVTRGERRHAGRRRDARLRRHPPRAPRRRRGGDRHDGPRAQALELVRRLRPSAASKDLSGCSKRVSAPPPCGPRCRIGGPGCARRPWWPRRRRSRRVRPGHGCARCATTGPSTASSRRGGGPSREPQRCVGRSDTGRRTC